jgi:hypothetical protein
MKRRRRQWPRREGTRRDDGGCRCSNGWRGRRRGWEYLGVFGSGLCSKTNGRKGKTGKGDKSLKQSSHFSTVLYFNLCFGTTHNIRFFFATQTVYRPIAREMSSIVSCTNGLTYIVSIPILLLHMNNNMESHLKKSNWGDLF